MYWWTNKWAWFNVGNNGMDFIRTKYIFFVKTIMTCMQESNSLSCKPHFGQPFNTIITIWRNKAYDCTLFFNKNSFLPTVRLISLCKYAFGIYNTINKKISFNRSPLNFRKYTPSNTIGLVYVSHVTYGSNPS